MENNNKNNYNDVGEIFSKFFSTKNANIRIKYNINKEEAKNGTIIKLKLHRAYYCGHTNNEEKASCKLCNGNGYYNKVVNLKLKTPKRLKDGQVLIYKNLGNQINEFNINTILGPMKQKGGFGDLIIKINIDTLIKKIKKLLKNKKQVST